MRGANEDDWDSEKNEEPVTILYTIMAYIIHGLVYHKKSQIFTN